MAREMKNSGVQWIGEIPKGWTVSKVKYHGSSSNGLTYAPADVCDENEGILVLRSSNIQNGKFRYLDNVYVKSAPKTLEVRQGDIVICSRNGSSELVGKCAIVEDEIYATYGAFMLRFHPLCNNKYVYYLLTTTITNYKASFATTTINQLTQSVLSNMSLPYTNDVHEQQAIADFLDAKCAEIDGLLADLDAEVKTLAEYKKSIIAETVTRGLNPNVSMKQSGIPWAEFIPKHWDLHPVYHYFAQRIHKNIFGKEQNLLSLSYGKIIRKDINAVSGLLPSSFNTYNVVEVDDIVIRPTDLQNDKRSLRTGLVTEHGIITSAYIALKPYADIHSPYFHYLLHSYDIKKVFYNMGNGVRQGLSYSEFSRLMLFEPPKAEQIAIASYLDEKCEAIDKSIIDKLNQIETLKSYKASLIYEYVTGKKQVN